MIHNDGSPVVGRTPFERAYFPHFSKRAWSDAVAALLATPAVKRKYFAGARGAYRVGGHYVVAPARFEMMRDGAAWIGVVAHEFGHAVDFFGRGLQQGGRSVWLAPAMRRDRRRVVTGDAAVGSSRLAVEAECLMTLPPCARSYLIAIVSDRNVAERVARDWACGRMEDALAAMINRQRYVHAPHVEARSDPALRRYAIAKVGAFIAAVYDRQRGGGAARSYYRSFRHLHDGSLTIGHAAEVFANAFLADLLEGTELFSYLAKSAAPHTHAAYRAVLARIAQGLC